MTEPAKKHAQKNPTALREEEILAFWNKHDIFKKTLEKPAPNGDFVFYDGPPFATGAPHYGHVLAGTIKDVIPRFQTMRGKRVVRRWGWDCHGLPIENLIEKELGLSNKKDIENLGVLKFNEAARASVLRYAEEWKRIIPRTGRFVDMDNAYLTLQPSYMESVWWSFKTLYDKGLIYQGFKIMQLCPHCETTLANFEVNQGYKDITDISVYAKFELVDEPGTFLLAWTTTPWTLPGNVALAVNSGTEYVRAKKDGSTFILAKNLAQKVLKENYEITEEIKGKKLVGKKYKPVFDYYSANTEAGKKLEHAENGWKVYAADFVTTEDGTGIVHIAPAFGEDDYQLSLAEKLPFIQHVSTDGRFKKEVTDFAEKSVKPRDGTDGDKDAHQRGDVEIIKYLAAHNTLFAKEKIVHSYAHCWRCETPLLNYASSSWFLNVTKIKAKLIKENKKVNWLPEDMRDGRFGKWLEGARDWAISRSRYWGSTLPVWKCETCEKLTVIGSLDELKKHTSRGNKFFVLRHGEADSNASMVISTDPKNPHHLTEKGKEQIKAAAITLKKMVGRKGPDVIITSDFFRTAESAKIIAEAFGIAPEKIISDPRLREIQLAEYNMKPLESYGEFTSRHDQYSEAPKGGESLLDIRRRVGEFLYATDAQYKDATILIVSHQDTILMAAAAAEGGHHEKDTWSNYKKSWLLANGELRELPFAQVSHDHNYELDLHRPFIDDVRLECPCDGTMKKIPEVFDTWYESGSMPFAQYHYPFENTNIFNPKKGLRFPADFIAEGLDQTRGWFYTLAVLGAGLFDHVPYKQVIVNGLVLAEDGRKMSKSLKNYPDIDEVLNKYGADAMRYYMLTSPIVKGEDLRFSEKGVDEVLKKLSQRLMNVYSFYEMYRTGSDDAQSAGKKTNTVPTSTNVLDIWIVARLKQLAGEMTDALARYELDKATRPILSFVDDLSTWYLRRSRDRFKTGNEARQTTRFVFQEFSKLLAPVMPFLAEDIYQKLKTGEKMAENSGAESVHLESWPELGALSRAETVVLTEMARVRSVVSLGLEARAKAGIKARQPLASLSTGAKFASEYADIIVDEVNVKGLIHDSSLGEAVSLDTTITEDLRKEGLVRDLIRAIQEVRKEKGLQPGEKKSFTVTTDATNAEVFRGSLDMITSATSASTINFKIDTSESNSPVKISAGSQFLSVELDS